MPLTPTQLTSPCSSIKTFVGANRSFDFTIEEPELVAIEEAHMLRDVQQISLIDNKRAEAFMKDLLLKQLAELEGRKVGVAMDSLPYEAAVLTLHERFMRFGGPIDVYSIIFDIITAVSENNLIGVFKSLERYYVKASLANHGNDDILMSRLHKIIRALVLSQYNEIFQNDKSLLLFLYEKIIASVSITAVYGNKNVKTDNVNNQFLLDMNQQFAQLPPANVESIIPFSYQRACKQFKEISKSLVVGYNVYTSLLKAYMHFCILYQRADAYLLKSLYDEILADVIKKPTNADCFSHYFKKYEFVLELSRFYKEIAKDEVKARALKSVYNIITIIDKKGKNIVMKVKEFNECYRVAIQLQDVRLKEIFDKVYKIVMSENIEYFDKQNTVVGCLATSRLRTSQFHAESKELLFAVPKAALSPINEKTNLSTDDKKTILINKTLIEVNFNHYQM